jgi:hypothetical protein
VEFITEVTRDTWYEFKFDEGEEMEVVDEAPIPFVNVEDKPLFNGGNPQSEFAKYIVRHLSHQFQAAVDFKP